MAMRLDEVGVITATELMGGYCRHGTAARVNDVYCNEPIDRDTLIDAVGDTRKRLVVAEGHRPVGGVGSAAREVLVGKDTPPLRLAHPALRIMPGSGTPTERLAGAAIDAARHLLRGGTDRQSHHQDASTPTPWHRSAESS